MNEKQLEKLYLSTVWDSALTMKGIEGVPSVEDAKLAMVGTQVKIKGNL